VAAVEGEEQELWAEARRLEQSKQTVLQKDKGTIPPGQI
jgi:hypothetical protein